MLAAVSAKVSGAVQYLSDTVQYLSVPRTLLEVVRSLQYQKLSSLFSQLRQNLLSQIQQGKLSIKGYEFVLLAEFVAYFTVLSPGQLWYEIKLSEPVVVVRLKKILNILQRFEKLFLDVETLHLQPIDPESLVEQIQLMDPRLAWKMNQLIDDVHVIFENIFNFGIDAELLFDPAKNYFVDLLMQGIHIVVLSQQTQMLQQQVLPGLQGLSSTLQRQVQQFKTTFFSMQVPENIGTVLGLCMHMIHDGNTEQSQFLTQLMVVIPQTLLNFQGYVNQKFQDENLQTSFVELRDLEFQTRKVVQSFKYFKHFDMKNAFNLIALIAHIRSIFKLVKTYMRSFGHLHADAQTKIKTLLHHIKFEILVSSVVVMDELELTLMLAPGEISEKILPSMEKIYASVISFLSAYIKFSDEDKALVNLFDSEWYRGRLEASYFRQAMVKEKQRQLGYIFHCIKRKYDDASDLEKFKQLFYMLKDYIIQVDAVWFNAARLTLESGHLPTPMEIKNWQQLLELLQQDLINAQFYQCQVDISHQYLLGLQANLMYFMTVAKPEDLKGIAQRLWFLSAIVRAQDKVYFYHGPSQSLQPLASKKYPDLYAMSGTAMTAPDCLSILKDLDISCFNGLVLKILMAPQWFRWYWNFSLTPVNESAVLGLQDQDAIELESLTIENLQALVIVYQAQLQKITHIKGSILNLLNDIHRLSQPYETAVLSPYNQRQLLYKLLLAGPYLGSVHEILAILSHQLVEIAQLKNWARAQYKPLLLMLNQAEKTCIDRASLLWTHCRRRLDLQDQNHFTQLQQVSRPGYFLGSQRYSESCRYLVAKLQQYAIYYMPEVQECLRLPSSGYYTDLIQPDELYQQAKQVLEYKLVFNGLYLLLQFFEKLEAQQKTDLANTFANLRNKFDITASFLAAQAYWIPGGIHFSYHRQVCVQAWKKIQIILMKPLQRLDDYTLSSSDEYPVSGLDHVVHWVLNGDEIFQDLVHPHLLEPLFKQRLVIQTQLTIQKIQAILAHTHDISLFTEIFAIYRLMRELKTRFFRLLQEVYLSNQQHLSELKIRLFAELSTVIDQMEIDFGIQPQYFSDKFLQVFSILFEHYFLALRPDLLVFAKLNLDPGLQQYRQQYCLQRLMGIEPKIHQMQQKAARFTHFIEKFEALRPRILQLPVGFSKVEQLKQLFQTDILPELQSFFVDYHHVLPVELMSSEAKDLDQLFNYWAIENRQINLEIHDYVNFIYRCKKHLDGQLHSLELEQRLLQAKQQHLQRQIQDSVETQDASLQHYVELYFDAQVDSVVEQRKRYFQYFAADYEAALREFFVAGRSQYVESFKQRLTTLYSQPWHFSAQQDLSQGPMHDMFDDHRVKVLENFDCLYSSMYCSLESIVHLVSQYRHYLENIQTVLAKQKHRFEDEHTIQDKLRLLIEIYDLAMNKQQDVPRRLKAALDILSNPTFKLTLRRAPNIDASLLIKYWNQFLYQLLRLLSYVGIFCEAQKPELWLRQFDQWSKSITPLSQFSFMAPMSPGSVQNMEFSKRFRISR